MTWAEVNHFLFEASFYPTISDVVFYSGTIRTFYKIIVFL